MDFIEKNKRVLVPVVAGVVIGAVRCWTGLMCLSG